MKKRVLITGDKSYIGEYFENYVKDIFEVDTISVKGDDWKSYDMSSYDSVYHVAGIAHVKPTPEITKLYKSVNRDLAIEVAKKAKLDGVKQFIFMSSMSVYGDHYTISKPQIIDENTEPNPDTEYGLSKLNAETELEKLNSNIFKVLILRPPMVYGDKAKGNYNKLLSKKRFFYFFPDFDNKRSTISILNLCKFLIYSINNNLVGIACPFDKEFLNTTKLIKNERMEDGKKTITTKLFNPGIKVLGNHFNVVKKLFGSNYYIETEQIQDVSVLWIKK